MVVVSCSNDGDTTDECESECPGTMRIVADAGISVDADSITVQICHLQDCGQVEMEVPATAETVSSEGEPLVSVTVTRTDDFDRPHLEGRGSGSLRLSSGGSPQVGRAQKSGCSLIWGRQG
jgi:hypothetical protein